MTPGAQMQGRLEATLTATAYRFAPDAIVRAGSAVASASRPQGASAAKGRGENGWTALQQRRALSAYSFRCASQATDSVRSCRWKSPKVARSASVSLAVTSSESARRRDVLDEAVAECQDRTT